tara:strand:- start:2399 stop:2905 length:507 start_codon:yes stop_codon:yes gene_type:complete
MKKKDKKVVKSKKINNSDLLKKNQELLVELDKYKDEKLRLMADFENLKKRKNDQISELIKYSGQELIISLIPIFNDLDRILLESKNIKQNKALLDGLKITINKLYKILENQGIVKFDSEGDLFDPNLHDAMMAKDSKKKKNIIVEEFEKGYKYNDKVIKHSKVVVSKG